ncbi:fibrillin-2, partial [Biomphalaria glabrata]
MWEWGHFLIAFIIFESSTSDVTVYTRLTLTHEDLQVNNDEVAAAFQQIMQSWMDDRVWGSTQIIVSIYDIMTSSYSTEIVYNVTLEQLSLYDSEIMDDYLKDFSYNQIVSQPRVLSVNGTYYEILTFKVYETSEEATLGINPK